VTVTGLTDGAASDVTVTATDPGVSVASAVEHGAALLAGTAPVVSDIASTVDGFTFHLDLSDDSVTYSATSAPGTVSMDPDGTVTVTGLTPGESADVTISAIQAGHATTTTTVTGSALLTGIAPLFAAPQRTSDGFTVAIDNLDADGVYAVSSSGGTATVAAGVITVTGLAPDAAATVTVTVSHVGYTDGVSTTSGSALAAGVAPTFTDVAPTADGFTFTIADYDASLTYTTQLSPTGVVVIDGSGHGVVSGLAPGTSATLAVTATDPGVSTATATTGATVLLPTAAVQLSASTPLAGGYSFRILDYDPAVTYTFTQADGGTVVRSGDTVTVSGLGAAVTSVTTVSATSAGHTVEVATASGTSFPDGAAPGIGAVTRTLDGFTFTFTADPSATYTAASDAGTVTIAGSTVTVTGLAAGATTTVHLTASVPGSLDATSDVAGTAIALGVTPVLGSPAPTAHGFVVVIANYSALTAYRLSTSAGTVTRNGDRITVAGLAAGASATFTVTAVRSGYRDASATRAGSATAPVVPGVPTPTTVPTPPAPTTSTGTTATESSDVGGAGIPPALQGVDESTPGTGTVQSNGAAVPSKLSSQGDRVVLTTGHGFRLTVSGWQHGHVTPIGPDGVIEVLRGGTTRVIVSGLAPDSEIAMWGMSHLQQLVTTRTDHEGALTQLVRLPYSMAPGAHTLIVTGVDVDGHEVTMQVGIRVLRVAHEAPDAPAVGGSWWWLLLVALIAVLGLIAWFVIARRRRQRREA
jgi:titin